MSWLIAVVGGIGALAIAVLAAVAGMYGTGYGGESGHVLLVALGAVAWLLSLAAVVCALGAVRAAATGAAPGRVAIWIAVPLAGAAVLAAIPSLIESMGGHL